MKTVRTRNVFITSESHEDGLGRSRIACPPQPFSLQPGEFMRLTLLSFSMPRAWSNVNASNNTFYWWSPADAKRYKITIPYATPDDLAAAVTLGLADLFNDNLECKWNAAARRIEFTTGPTMKTAEEGTIPVAANDFFVSYSDKTALDAHHDTHHLLGLIPSTGLGKETNAMAGNTVGAGAHAAVLPPVLHTVDALYLRSSMQSESMQTHNFDAGSPLTQEVTHSSIVARIPVTDASDDYVRFDEGGHLWEVYPLTRQLDHLNFWVTDDKGRKIAPLVPGLYRGGILAWNAAFRWETMVTDLPPKPEPRGEFTGYYHNALTAQT